MRKSFIALLFLIPLTQYTTGQRESIQQTEWKEFRSILTLTSEKKYDKALEDLDKLTRANQNTELAARATMESGRIYLNGKKDPGKALIYFSELVKNPKYHPYADLLSEANFRIGEIKLAKARERNETMDAQAEFDRVYRTYPDSEWAADALLQSAMLSERLQNAEAAIDKYQRLAMEYGGSNAAQARLSLAIYQAFRGNPRGALIELQTIRNQFPESDKAKLALLYLTGIYRFYRDSLGVAAKPYKAPQDFQVRAVKEFLDPYGMAVTDEEEVFIADRGSKRVFKVGREGKLIQTLTLSEPGLITAAADGHIYIADQNGARRTRDNIHWRLSTTTPKGETKPLRRITSLAVDSAGDIYAISADHQGVVKYSISAAKGELFPRRQNLRNIKQVRVDALDNVYLLDDKENKILIYNRTGELLHQLSLSGKGARGTIADFSVGPLNYIYVLGRSNAFYIYEVTHKPPQAMTTKLLSTVQVTPRVKETPETIGVSRSGTVFLAGRKNNTVLIFR